MLDHSREFLVLAANLNYRTAATLLNISQPSLSRHIVELEKELGFKLFERNPLALTPAGRFYMESISDIIEHLDSVIKQGCRMAQEDSQTLSIYMLPSTGSLYSTIAYESITRIQAEQTDFSPRFQYNDRLFTIFDAVSLGKADVGFLLDKPSNLPDDLACEWLVNSPAIAWLHEDNPLLRLESLKFEDLADCYILSSTNQSSRTWLDGMIAIFRKAGVEPKIHLKDLDNRESFFINLAPDEVLLESTTAESICQINPRLVRVDFNDPALEYSVYLLYRKSPEKPLVGKFVETCHQVAKEISSELSPGSSS